MEKVWRVIIDTNVLVAALKSNRGASFRVLSLITSKKFEVNISVALICEYEDVLKRPALGINLTTEEIDKLLDVICLFGVKHKIWFMWRPLLSDEKDEFIADLALNSQIDAIITYNLKHFRSLEKFGIKIVEPSGFLRLIGEIL